MQTALQYLAADAEDLHTHPDSYETAFNRLGEKDLCSGADVLEKISTSLR